MSKTVTWNFVYGTYEYIHDNGYIEIFRDDVEARKFAEEHGLEFEEEHDGNI